MYTFVIYPFEFSIPVEVCPIIMLYPYGYICVNDKICADIHIYSKIQVNTGSIEVILFMHEYITQMHEQLFIQRRNFIFI